MTVIELFDALDKELHKQPRNHATQELAVVAINLRRAITIAQANGPREDLNHAVIATVEALCQVLRLA